MSGEFSANAAIAPAPPRISAPAGSASQQSSCLPSPTKSTASSLNPEAAEFTPSQPALHLGAKDFAPQHTCSSFDHSSEQLADALCRLEVNVDVVDPKHGIIGEGFFYVAQDNAFVLTCDTRKMSQASENFAEIAKHVSADQVAMTVQLNILTGPRLPVSKTAQWFKETLGPYISTLERLQVVIVRRGEVIENNKFIIMDLDLEQFSSLQKFVAEIIQCLPQQSKIIWGASAEHGLQLRKYYHSKSDPAALALFKHEDDKGVCAYSQLVDGVIMNSVAQKYVCPQGKTSAANVQYHGGSGPSSHCDRSGTASRSSNWNPAAKQFVPAAYKPVLVPTQQCLPPEPNDPFRKQLVEVDTSRQNECASDWHVVSGSEIRPGEPSHSHQQMSYDQMNLHYSPQPTFSTSSPQAGYLYNGHFQSGYGQLSYAQAFFSQTDHSHNGYTQFGSLPNDYSYHDFPQSDPYRQNGGHGPVYATHEGNTNGISRANGKKNKKFGNRGRGGFHTPTRDHRFNPGFDSNAGGNTVPGYDANFVWAQGFIGNSYGNRQQLNGNENSGSMSNSAYPFYGEGTNNNRNGTGGSQERSSIQPAYHDQANAKNDQPNRGPKKSKKKNKKNKNRGKSPFQPHPIPLITGDVSSEPAARMRGPSFRPTLAKAHNSKGNRAISNRDRIDNVDIPNNQNQNIPKSGAWDDMIGNEDEDIQGSSVRWVGWTKDHPLW